MKRIAFIKKHAMALVAIAFAIGSLTVMSFSKSNTDQEDLHWYIKVDGQWQEDIVAPNPSLSCPGGSSNLCAKGFRTAPNEPVSDMTPAIQNRFYGP